MLYNITKGVPDPYKTIVAIASYGVGLNIVSHVSTRGKLLGYGDTLTGEGLLVSVVLSQCARAYGHRDAQDFSAR